MFYPRSTEFYKLTVWLKTLKILLYINLMDGVMEAKMGSRLKYFDFWVFEYTCWAFLFSTSSSI
jgi:hypothetical protein